MVKTETEISRQALAWRTDKIRRHEIKLALIDLLKADQEIKWILIAAGGGLLMKFQKAIANDDPETAFEVIGSAWERFGGLTLPGLWQDLSEGDISNLTMPGLINNMVKGGIGGGILGFALTMLVLGKLGGADGIAKLAMGAI